MRAGAIQKVAVGVWAAVGVFSCVLAAAEVSLSAGRAAMEDGLHSLAERYFLRAWEEEPGTPLGEEAAVGVSRALFAQGRYEEQVAWAEDREPASPPPRALQAYWTAMSLHALGRYEEALARLDTISPPFPDPEWELRWLRLKARILYRAGHLEAALAAFEELAGRYVGEAPADFFLDWAALLLAGGRTGEAAALLAELHARYPETDAGREGLFWLGRMLGETGEQASAEADLEILGASVDTDAALRVEAWLLLAAISESRGDLLQARDHLQAAADLAEYPALRARTALFQARLQARGDPSREALEVLQDWIAAHPDHPGAEAAQLEMAELLLHLESFEEASVTFQRFLDAFAGGALASRAHAGMGQSLLAEGKALDAAAAFEAAARHEENAARRRTALLRSGDALFSAERYGQARDRYLEVTRLFPGSHETPQALFQAAQALAREGGIDGALRELRAIEDAFPDSSFAEQAALEAALWIEREGRWEAAVAAYERVLATYPEGSWRARALTGLGMVRYRLGRFEQALQDFRGASEAAPATEWDEQSLYMRIWCLYLLGREGDALALSRSFTDRFPSSSWAPKALFWLAEYHYNRGLHAEAEQFFSEVSTRFPKAPLADSAIYWAGRSASGLKDFLAAIEHYERLLTLYPESGRQADARFMQGDALAELGRFSAAILAFEDVIRRFPDSYRADLARGRKGDCQFTLGSEDPARYSEALASYQALRERPDLPAELRWQADYKIGRCYEKMGEVEEALARYMEVVYDYLLRPEAGDRGGVWFTRAAFQAAALEEARGRWSEAARIYARVASSAVPAADEARKQIQRIRLEHWFRAN